MHCIHEESGGVCFVLLVGLRVAAMAYRVDADVGLLVGIEVFLQLKALATVLMVARPRFLIRMQQFMAVERTLLDELFAACRALELLRIGMQPSVLCE